MKLFSWLAAITSISLLGIPGSAAALVVGQVDDFESGGTQGWTSGFPNPNPPVAVAGGGPDGATDGFLKVVSTGGFGGAGSRLVTYNDDQWTGNYLAAGITDLALDVNNFGNTTVQMRLWIEGPGGQFVSLDSVPLSPGSGWQSASFSLDPSAWAGAGNIAATLGSVARLRIFHNTSTSIRGNPIAAELGLDNIAALAVLPTLTSVADGDWNAAATWDDGVLLPTAEIDTVVAGHAVTVAADGSGRTLSIDGGQSTVTVGTGHTLTIADRVDVDQGALRIEGSLSADSLHVVDGTLDVSAGAGIDLSGGMTLAGSALTADITDAVEPIINAAGDVELGAGNSLHLQVTESLGSVGDASRTLVAAAGPQGVVGTFAAGPSPGAHLGFGVFHQRVEHGPNSVDVQLFQALSGDTDGNRDVNGFDIQAILAANKFGKPLSADWTEGDFTGDGFVNGFDIQAILAANQFGKGPYAAIAPPAGAAGLAGAVAVPEPGTLFLLLTGTFVALAPALWQIRRRVRQAD